MYEYQIYEMFYSLKGEGVYTGVPMVFLRFATCNRACDFCDTPRPAERAVLLSTKQILNTLYTLSSKCDRCVVTGGEPFHQERLRELVASLIRAGYIVHFETNGDLLPKHLPWAKDRIWMACSPKDWLPCYPPYVDEFKWLVGDGKELWQKVLSDRRHHPALQGSAHNILQPVWHPQESIRERNLRTTIHLAKEYPEVFRMNIQLHKALGIK